MTHPLTQLTFNFKIILEQTDLVLQENGGYIY